MTSRINRLLTTVILLILAISSCLAQPKTRDRKISFDCVICHVGWHEKINEDISLIPIVDTPIQIAGLPAHIPMREMCYTCHDGTVKDSRQVFSSHNHQLGMDMTRAKIKDMPLDKNGEIYCGTCHTPHSLKPEQFGGLAPFLREEVSNSSLCIKCHSDQEQAHINHPIHTPANPSHKMPAGTFFGPNNTVECMTCHPIHGEQGTRGVVGRDRSALCSSCHESYFNIELTDHDLTTALHNKGAAIGPSFDDQDVCAACHSSHNGNGDNMWAGELNPTGGKNSYCLSCHSNAGLAREKAFTHLGHPVSGLRLEKTIPTLGIESGDELACTACHDPHQWDYSLKHAVTQANEEGSEYNSFLRLPDDAEGQLCIACHQDQKSIRDSDHSVAREGFQQHFRSSGVFNGQCSACHQSHGAEGLKADGAQPNSDLTRYLCESCHSDAHYPTTIGGFDHPLGDTLSNELNLPTYQSELTCVTCHDPHEWGAIRDTSLIADLEGNDANSFLRRNNWPKPNLCIDCHATQATILNTDHDLSDANHSACSFCHSSHNAKAEFGILNFWDETVGNSYNERFCFSCHQEKGIAHNKIPEAWSHPQDYGTVTRNKRGTGEWIDFPLFEKDKPRKTFGFIDCFTCHDPHKWSFNEDLSKSHAANKDGDFMTSFLRNPSHKTLCTDCHGANTLWKYNYYHDPAKRKRY